MKHDDFIKGKIMAMRKNDSSIAERTAMEGMIHFSGVVVYKTSMYSEGKPVYHVLHGITGLSFGLPFDKLKDAVLYARGISSIMPFDIPGNDITEIDMRIANLKFTDKEIKKLDLKGYGAIGLKRICETIREGGDIDIVSLRKLVNRVLTAKEKRRFERMKKRMVASGGKYTPPEGARICEVCESTILDDTYQTCPFCKHKLGQRVSKQERDNKLSELAATKRQGEDEDMKKTEKKKSPATKQKTNRKKGEKDTNANGKKKSPVKKAEKKTKPVTTPAKKRVSKPKGSPMQALVIELLNKNPKMTDVSLMKAVQKKFPKETNHQPWKYLGYYTHTRAKMGYKAEPKK